MAVTGDTDVDHGGIPQNSVLVPGNPKPVMMRGSTNVSTDNNSNTTTPVSFNLEQIGEVLFTLGQKIKDGSISVAIASDQIVGIQQADLSTSGTINAAQPVIGTPVTGASVVLAVGQGQSTWKALLSDGGGGFTGATTIVADKSIDGGTTWIPASFKVSGASPATSQSSVVGPGPLELTGNAAGVTHIKIRCSARNGTETIAVVLRAGAGIGDVGLLSPIPAGQNLIGYVEDIEQQGYVALSSPPATTNVGSDTTLTFSSQVNRVIIVNNTNANANFDFDQAASAGSFLIGPGSMIIYPKKCTVFHLLTASAQNINGSSAGNIIVRGAM